MQKTACRKGGSVGEVSGDGTFSYALLACRDGDELQGVGRLGPAVQTLSTTDALNWTFAINFDMSLALTFITLTELCRRLFVAGNLAQFQHVFVPLDYVVLHSPLQTSRLLDLLNRFSVGFGTTLWCLRSQARQTCGLLNVQLVCGPALWCLMALAVTVSIQRAAGRP